MLSNVIMGGMLLINLIGNFILCKVIGGGFIKLFITMILGEIIVVVSQ
jgi:hypothetical protein